MTEPKNDLNFNDVYSDYIGLVSEYVNMRIFNKQESEDLIMKVFGRVAKHLPNYDPERGAKLNTWIFTITNNLIIDYFRKRDVAPKQLNVSDYKNDNGVESFEFISKCDTNLIIENNELKQKIMQSFDTLKGLHKRVAQMYLIENRKQDEIARLLDIPIGTVKGTLSRAKEKLGKMLLREKKEYGIA